MEDGRRKASGGDAVGGFNPRRVCVACLPGKSLVRHLFFFYPRDAFNDLVICQRLNVLLPPKAKLLPVHFYVLVVAQKYPYPYIFIR